MDGPVVIAIALIGLCLAGMATHVWICIAEAFATNAVGWVALLLGGLAFFPIGIVHGWGAWVGVW